MPDDATAIFAILKKDPEIAQHFVTWTAGLKSEEEVRAAITEYQKSRYFFGIISGEKLVGYIGTWKVTDSTESEREEYDMGYFIDPDMRGTGIVTAAAQALIDTISQKLSVEIVDLWIWDENEPSKAVARKLGAHPTDTTAFDELLGVTDRCWQLEVKK